MYRFADAVRSLPEPEREPRISDLQQPPSYNLSLKLGIVLKSPDLSYVLQHLMVRKLSPPRPGKAVEGSQAKTHVSH